MRWVCQLLLLLLVFLQENQNGTTSHNNEGFFPIHKQFCLFKNGETPVREDEGFTLWDYLFTWVSQCNWKLVLFMGFWGILLEIVLLEVFTSFMTRPGLQPQGQLTAFHWVGEEVPETSPRKVSGSKPRKRSRSRRHFGTISENDDVPCYTEYSYQDITPALPGRGESVDRSSTIPASSGRRDSMDRGNIIPISPRRDSTDRGNIFPASPGRRDSADRSNTIPASLGRRESAESSNFFPVPPVRRWSLARGNIATTSLARRDSMGCQFNYPFSSGAPRTSSMFHSELREHPPCQRHLAPRECEIIPFSQRKTTSILKTPNPKKHRNVRFSSTCPYTCVRSRTPASENREGTYFLCPPALLRFPNNRVQLLGENIKRQILPKLPVSLKKRVVLQQLKPDLQREMPLSGAENCSYSKAEETPLIVENSSGEKKEKPSDGKTEETLSKAEKSSSEGKEPKGLARKDQESPQSSSLDKNQPPPSGDKQKNNILEPATRKPILKSASPKMTKRKVKDDPQVKSTENSALSSEQRLGKVVISQGNWEITTEAETSPPKDLSPAPQGQTMLSTDKVREMQVSTSIKEKNLKVTCSLKMHERKSEAVHLRSTQFPKTRNPQNPTPESQNDLNMHTGEKTLETRQGLKPETVNQSHQKVHSFQKQPVPEEEGTSKDHTSAKGGNQNFRSKEEMQPSELNLQHEHPTSLLSYPTTILKPLQEVTSQVPASSQGSDPGAAEGAKAKASQTETVSAPKKVRETLESQGSEKQTPRRSGLSTQALHSSRTHRPGSLGFRERHDKKKADKGLQSTVSSVFPDGKTEKGLECRPRKRTTPEKQGIVKQEGETPSKSPSPSSESGPVTGKETVIVKKLDITHHRTTQKHSVAIKMHLLLNPNSSVTHTETREIPQACALRKLSPEELNKLTMSLGVKTLEMKRKTIPETVWESFKTVYGCGRKETQPSEIRLKSQVSKSSDQSWPSMEEKMEKALHPEDLDIKHKRLLESPVENLLSPVTQELEINNTQETRGEGKAETSVFPLDAREQLEQRIYEIPPSMQALIKTLIAPDFHSEFPLMSTESSRSEQPETSSTMSAETVPPHDVISNTTDSPPLPEKSPPLPKKKEKNLKVHFQMSELEERDLNQKEKTIPHVQEREQENTQKSVPLQKSPPPSEEVSDKSEMSVEKSGVECECYELQRYESFPVYADLHRCPCEMDLRTHSGFQRCRMTEKPSPTEKAGTTPNPDSVPTHPGRRHIRGCERHSLCAVSPSNNPHQTRKMKSPIHKSQSHHRASDRSVRSSDGSTGPHSVFSPKTDRGASQPPLPESTDEPLDEKQGQFPSPPRNQKKKKPPAQLPGKSNKYLDYMCNYEEVAEMQRRRRKKKEVNAKLDTPEVSRSREPESAAAIQQEDANFISRFTLKKPFFYICTPAGSPGARHNTIRWNIPRSILSQSGFRTPLIARFSDSWNMWRSPKKLTKSLSASFGSDSPCHQ
ncbi:coiled-coil domain-containing protein 168 isoform X2 [Tachyglossus aculeatus]|uniref:coiled-coil domain-containing protein 168 isoform X2 n=1 Tax=Tachyglossus aculeatus TaxID=9261 RepID=UPI0018F32FB7|nr:coiled-coil domain-containing protein 168 isoform X2 [Tachyglossus aculeatus]